MKKNRFTYNSEGTFFNWLSHLEKKDGGKRYTQHSIDTYASRLRLFVDKFYERDIRQLERDIAIPVMACCLCEALQEPGEMLKGQERQLLADAFFDEHLRNFDNFNFDIKPPVDKFEKMVSFLCQKGLGVKYQNVLNLFFNFLKNIDGSEYSILYQKIEQRLKIIHQKGLVYLKYGYIEATQTTPALIIARGGQDYISVLSLQNIFDCDRRTIKKMLKDRRIPCWHHRKDLYNLSDINFFFKKTYLTQQKWYIENLESVSDEEKATVHTYKRLCNFCAELKELDKGILNKEKLTWKRQILKAIIRQLLYYQEEIAPRANWWQGSKRASIRIGKSVRTLQRRAKKGKILSFQIFRRKKAYFDQNFQDKE